MVVRPLFPRVPYFPDELPFASTREGGQVNRASLRRVPASQQINQGVKLGLFYGACNIVSNDPAKGLFAVAFTPVTMWTCGVP